MAVAFKAEALVAIPKRYSSAKSGGARLWIRLGRKINMMSKVLYNFLKEKATPLEKDNANATIDLKLAVFDSARLKFRANAAYEVSNWLATT